MKRLLLLLLIVFIGAGALRAVDIGSTPDTTAPTNSNIPGWTSGWGATGITGWDYVCQINGGASGVYLGYVLTAGHVGQGNITIDGVPYAAVTNSSVGITVSGNPVDVCLFQLQTQPNLRPLVIRSSDPKAFFTDTSGSPVVMIGFGGGKSWGYNTVTQKNASVQVNQFTSNDFVTDLGSYSNGSTVITNNAVLVNGDSGGGDFIYNSAASRWELAGINEAIGPDTGPITYSLFVQLNTYATQINNIIVPATTDTPTLPLPGLVMLGGLLLFVACRSFGAKVADAQG